MGEDSEKETMEIPRPRVFEYLEYRSYLADWFTYTKSKRESYSYRVFARDADLGSPNYLKLVIEGKRNLSEKMATRFADTLGLKGEAYDFFLALVTFTQAKSLSKKGEARQELMRFAYFRKIRKLETRQFYCFSKWYVPAIHELMMRDDFQNDAEWISQQLVPPISKRDARTAIQTLLDLGIVSERNGELKLEGQLFSSGLEAPNDLLAKYHKQMMKMGAEAIDRHSRDQRDISTVTICMSHDGLARIKARVQEFRRELLELSAQESERSQVVQLNIQLFPLSTLGTQGKEKESL